MPRLNGTGGPARTATLGNTAQPDHIPPGRNGQGGFFRSPEHYCADLKQRILRSIRRGQMKLANTYQGRLIRLRGAGQ